MRNLFLLFFVMISFTFADVSIAVVKGVEGKVSVTRDKNVLHVKLGDRLYENDVLKTEDDGTIGIIFSDGSVLSLGPNSFLVIDKYLFNTSEDEFDFKLNMKKGTALFETGKISKIAPESFAFNIPEGSIGVRGTKFFVEVK